MKNRIIALVILLLLLLTPAIYAQGSADDLSAYLQYGDSAKCISILADALVSLGYKSAVGALNEDFDEGLESAVIDFQTDYDLSVHGALDPDTIHYIFVSVGFEDLLNYESSGDETVWIPIHGGKKYHSKSTCSNMITPCLVYEVDAPLLDFGPCGKCYK